MLRISREITNVIQSICGEQVPAINEFMDRCSARWPVRFQADHLPWLDTTAEEGPAAAIIYYNPKLDTAPLWRTLWHEMAEYLAAIDQPGLWDADAGFERRYDGASCPQDARHLIAVECEDWLAKHYQLDEEPPAVAADRAARFQSLLNQAWHKDRAYIPDPDRLPCDECL